MSSLPAIDNFRYHGESRYRNGVREAIQFFGSDEGIEGGKNIGSEILAPIMRNGEIISPWEIYNDMRKSMHDTAFLLDPDEVTAIEQTILKVLRWKTKLDDNIPGVGPFCPVKQIGAGMKKYDWYKWLDVPAPRNTDTFEGGFDVKVLKQKTTNVLHGMDYDFHITKTDIDAARSTNGKIKLLPELQMGILQNLMEQLALYRDWYGFRGTDAGDLQDITITGLLNDSGLTDPGAGGIGADDDMTAQADVFHSAVELSNKLIQNKFEPPFVLDMTPGLWSQANMNRNTTSDKTDMRLILEYVGANGGNSPIFAKVRMNPFLIDSATETNNTAAMGAFAPSMDNYFLAEAYPLGAYPLPPQGLSAYDMKLLWMGRAIVTRPAAIQYINALTINVL